MTSWALFWLDTRTLVEEPKAGTNTEVYRNLKILFRDNNNIMFSEKLGARDSKNSK